MDTQTMFNDPAFAQYVYDCMEIAPKARVLELDPSDLLHFATQKTMRRFADRASLEERLRMLSLLGYSFCMVLSHPGKDVGPIFDDIYSQYSSATKRSAIVEAMAKNKLFVVSSRDVLVSAHLAATNCHSKLYTLNYNYVAIRNTISRLDKYLSANRYADAEKGLQQLARIAYTNLIYKDIPQVVTGLSPTELSILLVLYQKRNAYIDGERLREIIDKNLLEGTINRMLIRLDELKYVQYVRHKRGQSNDFRKRYTIMENGIIAVNNYLKYLVKQAMDV